MRYLIHLSIVILRNKFKTYDWRRFRVLERNIDAYNIRCDKTLSILEKCSVEFYNILPIWIGDVNQLIRK